MTTVAPPSVSTPNSPLSARKYSHDAIFFRENAPPSPSPIRPIKSINDLNREYSDISIRVDPGSTFISRRNSDVSLSDTRPRSRFPIHHSLDYDAELVRRQFAMIATQPMNMSEEIDEKRRLLRMKVEARKRADDITKAAGTLGLIGIGNIHSGSKSPSPTPKPVIPKVVISKSKDKSAKSHIIPTKASKLKAPLSPRKGPKNATQAAKVTKKVVSGANKSNAVTKATQQHNTLPPVK